MEMLWFLLTVELHTTCYVLGVFRLKQPITSSLFIHLALWKP